MRSYWIVSLLVIALCAPVALPQGGKAEPRRIEFAKGRSSATVSGTLSNGQEMDHVFKATAGQKISLNVTSKPKGKLFDFRITGDGFEIETDHDSYVEYSLVAPETGDYLVFVRKRPTQTAARANFFETYRQVNNLKAAYPASNEFPFNLNLVINTRGAT